MSKKPDANKEALNKIKEEIQKRLELIQKEEEAESFFGSLVIAMENEKQKDFLKRLINIIERS